MKKEEITELVTRSGYRAAIRFPTPGIDISMEEDALVERTLKLIKVFPNAIKNDLIGYGHAMFACEILNTLSIRLSGLPSADKLWIDTQIVALQQEILNPE